MTGARQAELEIQLAQNHTGSVARRRKDRSTGRKGARTGLRPGGNPKSHELQQGTTWCMEARKRGGGRGGGGERARWQDVTTEAGAAKPRREMGARTDAHATLQRPRAEEGGGAAARDEREGEEMARWERWGVGGADVVREISGVQVQAPGTTTTTSSCRGLNNHGSLRPSPGRHYSGAGGRAGGRQAGRG